MMERSEQRPTGGGRERVSMRLAIVMLIILALSYVINSMDRQVFPILLPTVVEDLGDVRLAQAGLLSTIFTLGIAAIGFPAGRMVDRFSRKYIIMVGIAIYSIFTILTALAFGYWDMLLVRAITGVGEGMQQAAMFAAAGAYFYMHRAMAIGVLNFAFGAGAFIGPFLGGFVTGGPGSWRRPLFIYRAAGLVFVGIIPLTG